ncbi:hypothetical protein P8S53_06910 [Roseinatronobacter sp. S2]|nr:DUF6538 domain-containing protein [Roseinatronobacter sp. S2]WFE76124.1 hypothetical protein P8S53_06910 [Roseinatronobacter sp. S2]
MTKLLVPIIGKEFIKHSLNTKDKAQAKKLRPLEDMRADALFAAAENQLAQLSSPQVSIKTTGPLCARWGQALFGIDNALIGDWPAVRIQDGKACIVAFGSVPDWLSQHEAALHREMSARGQLSAQCQDRGGLSLQGLAPRQAYPAA